MLEKGIQVRQEDYEQVYTGTLYPQDSPERVRERLGRHPPRSFAGHSVSVSDVLVFHRPGTVISYYVEKNGFTVIEDFIKNESSSSGAVVSIDTVNFHIEGKGGSWLARYAYAHGMEIAGITAKHECGHILSWPGIEELNLAIEKGLADILLVKETGRLVRGFTQAAEYLEWLEQKGVCVVCMDEPASVRYNLVNMVTDASSL